jgi:hypothetical protein
MLPDEKITSEEINEFFGTDNYAELSIREREHAINQLLPLAIQAVNTNNSVEFINLFKQLNRILHRTGGIHQLLTMQNGSRQSIFNLLFNRAQQQPDGKAEIIDYLNQQLQQHISANKQNERQQDRHYFSQLCLGFARLCVCFVIPLGLGVIIRSLYADDFDDAHSTRPVPGFRP